MKGLQGVAGYRVNPRPAATFLLTTILIYAIH